MLDRRRFLSTCSGMGLGSTLFPGVLYALAQNPPQGATQPVVTPDMIDQAAKIADVVIAEDYKKAMLNGLNGAVRGYEEIYKLHLPNSAQPAIIFDPVLPGMKLPMVKAPMKISAAPAMHTGAAPKNLEDAAFFSVRELAELVRTRKVTSTNLTEMYLARLKRLDEKLHCLITPTDERAKAQAKEADKEIAAGKYRGPLHGLPWGAKDLFAVKGYRTTWGAGGFEEQMIDEDATVVQRLDKAGAVLIAKLTLGALAQGDRWFKGITRNPWNPEQGSSGSSAGTSSAVAAGCIAFGLGTETLGSISSPATRCGCTGLRPTFGMTPRTGAMALSWTMDKIGPICRAVEDCAIVLDSIYGPDGKDRSVMHKVAFNWDATADWKKFKVGYLKSDFELAPMQPLPPLPDDATDEQKKARADLEQRRPEIRKRTEMDHKFDEAALAKLEKMGVKMTEVKLPDLPYGAMRQMLTVEAAAAFDELTRSGRDKLLTEQAANDWPNTFRQARFVPGVEYVQASRARYMAMEQVNKAIEGFDVIVAPTNSGQLTITNLTGHPSIILPNGFRGDDAPKFTQAGGGNYGGPGTPVSLTFLGQLFGEAKLLAFAKAYQDATGFQLKHPKLD
jgi:Asp-tRNA(Asn)/Glu-tRNA(Gln) amidotransferase A subunit family amidase